MPMFIFIFLAAIPIHDLARKTARYARERRRHQLILTFERYGRAKGHRPLGTRLG